MGLLSATLIFGFALGLLLTACRTFEYAADLFSVVGWFVVLVYAANLATRWTLAILPKTAVDPKNKTVLITGCDTGFGHSLAQRLCKDGFQVFAGCLQEDGEGATLLKQLCPHGLHVIPFDVTRQDQVQAALKEIEAQLGDNELWAIVNNAGVAIFSELEWCSMGIIEHMFNVNVLGAVRVTKTFLPLLRQSRGRVVVVASVAGHITYPGFLSYSMTKHALVSFADGLRREMRKWGVKVTTIEPSMYKTRITRSDVLTGALDNSWERTPDAIKEAYGFPYYKDFRHKLEEITSNARPYLEEVVDCMEKAVLEEEPGITYRCAGPSDKVRLWLMSLIPVRMLDILICKVIQPSQRQLPSNGISPH